MSDGLGTTPITTPPAIVASSSKISAIKWYVPLTIASLCFVIKEIHIWLKGEAQRPNVNTISAMSIVGAAWYWFIVDAQNQTQVENACSWRNDDERARTGATAMYAMVVVVALTARRTSKDNDENTPFFLMTISILASFILLIASTFLKEIGECSSRGAPASGVVEVLTNEERQTENATFACAVRAKEKQKMSFSVKHSESGSTCTLHDEIGESSSLVSESCTKTFSFEKGGANPRLLTAVAFAFFFGGVAHLSPLMNSNGIFSLFLVLASTMLAFESGNWLSLCLAVVSFLSVIVTRGRFAESYLAIAPLIAVCCLLAFLSENLSFRALSGEGVTQIVPAIIGFVFTAVTLVSSLRFRDDSTRITKSMIAIVCYCLIMLVVSVNGLSEGVRSFLSIALGCTFLLLMAPDQFYLLKSEKVYFVTAISVFSALQVLFNSAGSKDAKTFELVTAFVISFSVFVFNAGVGGPKYISLAACLAPFLALHQFGADQEANEDPCAATLTRDGEAFAVGLATCGKGCAGGIPKPDERCVWERNSRINIKASQGNNACEYVLYERNQNGSFEIKPRVPLPTEGMTVDDVSGITILQKCQIEITDSNQKVFKIKNESLGRAGIDLTDFGNAANDVLDGTFQKITVSGVGCVVRAFSAANYSGERKKLTPGEHVGDHSFKSFVITQNEGQPFRPEVLPYTMTSANDEMSGTLWRVAFYVVAFVLVASVLSGKQSGVVFSFVFLASSAFVVASSSGFDRGLGLGASSIAGVSVDSNQLVVTMLMSLLSAFAMARGVVFEKGISKGIMIFVSLMTFAHSLFMSRPSVLPAILYSGLLGVALYAGGLRKSSEKAEMRGLLRGQSARPSPPTIALMLPGLALFAILSVLYVGPITPEVLGSPLRPITGPSQTSYSTYAIGSCPVHDRCSLDRMQAFTSSALFDQLGFGEIVSCDSQVSITDVPEVVEVVDEPVLQKCQVSYCIDPPHAVAMVDAEDASWTTTERRNRLRSRCLAHELYYERAVEAVKDETADSKQRFCVQKHGADVEGFPGDPKYDCSARCGDFWSEAVNTRDVIRRMEERLETVDDSILFLSPEEHQQMMADRLNE